jgi:hypothetical protein
VSLPWGDPVPASIEAVQTSFLDRPQATIDLLGDSYLDRFGGGVLLLAAGVLAPLVAHRSRRTLLAGAAVLIGLLVWSRSPVTGIAEDGALPETVFSTTRYALPVVAAACVALAVAATDGRRLRVVALLALAAAVVVNLVQTFELDFPVAPSAVTPLAGALVGAALLFAARWRAVRLPRLLLPVAALGAGALLAIPAGGFVERHGQTGSSLVAPVVRYLASDAQFEDGDEPVATLPAYIGPLAGDRLRHELKAIPLDASCPATARRARTEWLVLYAGTLGEGGAPRVAGCLPPAAFVEGALAVFRPRGP